MHIAVLLLVWAIPGSTEIHAAKRIYHKSCEATLQELRLEEFGKMMIKNKAFQFYYYECKDQLEL